MFKKTLFFFCINFFIWKSAWAISLIRDAQTENFIEDLIRPILVAANLEGQVKLYIVNDPSINAFVAGGKNIFINTGTITYGNSPLGLIGVLAHETGHITGGHLARMSLDLKQVNQQMALGYLLGIATALIGNADAGQALILGSSHAAERQFYSFSTKHEEAADEAALKFLDEAGVSAKGLLEFFKNIKANERIYFDTINPYTRTHPLTSARISRISEHLNNSEYSEVFLSPELNKQYQLIKTKLLAFLEPAEEVLRNYDTETENGKLAHIIANHRLGNSKVALKIFETLKNKADPYMQALKGQIFYESGQANEAVAVLGQVIKKLPDEALIKVQYGAAVVSSKNAKLYRQGINQLKFALITETDNVQAWNFLGQLYNRNQQEGLSFLALAEAEYIRTNYPLAIKYAERAKKILEKKGDIVNLSRAKQIIKNAKEEVKSN